MMVLDLQGLTGASFRFRRIDGPSDLPAQAGHFIVARAVGADGVDVRACGTRRSLVELASVWSDLTVDDGAVYVRLNVRRGLRLSEHADLVAALKPGEVLLERD